MIYWHFLSDNVIVNTSARCPKFVNSLADFPSLRSALRAPRNDGVFWVGRGKGEGRKTEVGRREGEGGIWGIAASAEFTALGYTC